jgi:flap endonuclease-1
MGIQLTDLIEGREITLEDIFDKEVAIDAFNWIYQFLSIIRQKDGEPLKDSEGRVTSHLSGLFYRTIKLMEAGMRPVYVFDGKPPEFKKETAEKRRDIRLEAMREWKKALEKKDYEAARKFAKQSATIDEEVIKDSKTLLRAMGLPVIQAPSEGEALCSVMAKRGDVYSIATQDYDSLLFGCPRIIRNLSITGKRKRGDSYITINPEIIVLKEVLESLKISQNQLIIIGILIGTDYNPGGVEGYGPKKALELVRSKKTLKAVLKDIIWDFPVSAEDIYEFFKNPITSDYKLEFRDPDEEEIKKILCDEHDFSEERISNAINKLKTSKLEQRSLSKWF